MAVRIERRIARVNSLFRLFNSTFRPLNFRATLAASEKAKHQIEHQLVNSVGVKPLGAFSMI